MKRLQNLVARFVSDEQGMETVEWAIMAALIVAAISTVIASLGGNVFNKFQGLVTATA